MPSFGIGGAVGNRPALNARPDQETVIDLLLRVPAADGGASDLPPAGDGPNADFRLVNAIFQFQRVMAGRGLVSKTFVDGRVDPTGKTLKLLERFAAEPRRGGGLVIPVDPPRPAPPAPPAKKGPGFLASLFNQMKPRPTNLQIAGGSSFSGSIAFLGSLTGDLDVMNLNNVGSVVRIGFAGAGLSLGPLPFGVEISPAEMPNKGSRISAGPRTQNTTLAIEDLLGVGLMIGISAGAGGGGNATAILFNIGRNRSLQTAAQDILNAVNPNGAISFVTDAFNTCKAFASTAGIFSGLSVGVSLNEVVMDRQSGPPNILPDPDVRRLINPG